MSFKVYAPNIHLFAYTLKNANNYHENWVKSTLFWQICLLHLAVDLGLYSLIKVVFAQITSHYLWYKCDRIISKKFQYDDFNLLTFQDLESEMHRPYAPLIKRNIKNY